MRFTLTVECGGDAFDPDATPEVVRLLAQAAQRCVMSPAGSFVDANGNRCGGWQWEWEDGDPI